MTADLSFHDPEVDPEDVAPPAVIEEQHISVVMSGSYAFHRDGRGPAYVRHVMAHFRKPPTAVPKWVFLGCEITGELEGGTKVERRFFPLDLFAEHRHAPAWLVTIINQITPK